MVGINCHVFEKTYAYGAIRAENQNLLFAISELKTRLENIAKGMNGASSVRRPMNRDSHVKNSVLANSKKSAKKVAVYVRNNKQTDNTSENVISNKENVIDVDVANASKCQNGFTKDEIFMAMTFDYNRSSLKPQCQMTLVRSSSSLGRQCQMVSTENNTSGPVPQCSNDV
ncbi:hypothetical protein Tco_0052689 [Tanacetum coccineum]